MVVGDGHEHPVKGHSGIEDQTPNDNGRQINAGNTGTPTILFADTVDADPLQNHASPITFVGSCNVRHAVAAR